MTIKDTLLEILEGKRGESTSGEELAATLSVSRNSIWKAIKQLQSDGYKIDAVTNKGYLLREDNDILSVQGIQKYLCGLAKKCRVETFKSVDSTNTVLRALAVKGEAEFKVVASEEQTAGKGRKGKSFFSASGTGIYFSILLRPEMPADKSLYITTAAAVAVVRAIKNVTNLDTKIKWVNDIFYNGKKLCGILTEAALDFEGGGLEYAVLGIGINVSDPKGGFEGELKNIATSLYGDKTYNSDLRNKLIAEVLNQFMIFYDKLTEKEFMAEYIDKSNLIGETVSTVLDGKEVVGTVAKIDEEAHLFLKFADGTEKELLAGEISLRLKSD